MNIKTVLGATVLAPALAFGSAAQAATLSPGDTIATWGDSFDDTYVETLSFDITQTGLYKATVRDREMEVEAESGGLNLFNPVDFFLLSVSFGSTGVGSVTIGPVASGGTSGSFTFLADSLGTYQATFVGLPGTDGAITDASLFGADVSYVPVPPAVWLFGSAVVGLAALGRSRARKAAAAA